jgi:ppGpp synthetase/RelA/SpoT-type nucleotidyltranferase
MSRGNMLRLTTRERKIITPLVRSFQDKRQFLDPFHDTLFGILVKSKDLKPLVHSFRSRIKDPDHLRDKLARKIREAEKKNKTFGITEKNLFTKINDLAGIRILHLHTTQIEQIDKVLKRIFDEFEYELIEGPGARTWDDEYRDFFKGIGFKTLPSESLYTSVHYVVGSKSQLKLTCEIQVRTLMEEVWGEVDHTINYPHQHKSVACREQIRALARATSTSTRLVDAIFAATKDIDQTQQKHNKRRKASKK